jgi:hypothetical protein
VVEPLPPELKGDWPRISDWATWVGTQFVLKSGIPWEMSPQERGCGSGMTCWRLALEVSPAGAAFLRRYAGVLWEWGVKY